MITAIRRKHFLWAPTLATALMAACGGGGGGGDGGGGGGGGTSLSLSGTAATGAAIANRPVEVRCAAGTGSANSGADGAYTVTIAAGQLPCVLRVTAANGTVLHSVAVGSGSTARANLTPATQLIVARLAAADPAGYYTAFGSASAAALTAAVVTAAQTAVVDTLRAGGVDFGAVADLVAGTLRAQNGGTTGNAYDQLLDALNARFAATGTTLAAITTAVVSQAAAAGGATPASGAVSLPPDLLLRAAAANCAALRSGTYRFVEPQANATLADQTGSFTLDAATLVATQDGQVQPAWTANGPCRFRANGGSIEVLVSQAGVLAYRSVAGGVGGTTTMGVALPAQTHALADLAGTWNLIGLERNESSPGYSAAAATLTLSATGVLGNLTLCFNEATWSVKGNDCATTATTTASLRANAAAGGFELIDSGETVATNRAYAFRAGNGELMLVSVDADGSFQYWTRQRTVALPVVAATSTSWNLYANAQLASTLAIDTSSNVINSVDAAAGSWQRTQSLSTQNFTRPETLFINNPRNGYILRQGGQVLSSIGTTVTVNEFTGLGLRGTGLTPLVQPGTRLFLLSVAQP
jgi:hypothetical protein